ncbi:DoxX family protein [Lutibacter sp. A64]|uniref:DoxX family protein n=1 Tax=Lutibacter sp. A64 TaxID=2918526 RepID=UPI001F05BA53|nr:DoxX family protein [Lutibacter sp. A64]UMB54937.1 DoxX family protein [Lutibacter sp. A64]
MNKSELDKLGNKILRLGLGFLFVWGGIEKLVVEYFGGVGLEKMANSLQRIGFGFLGESGTYALAIWLAVSELIAGLLILLNFKTFYASLYAAFILIVALFTVYITRGDWMQSMIHIALISAYIALGLQSYNFIKNK